MMNQRQNMFQLYVIEVKVYNIIILYIYIFFTNKNRQNAVTPVQLSNRKNAAEAIMNQRQILFLLYGLQHEMCSGIPVSCVETQHMFAAEMRESVLTCPLLHAASCTMQKHIARFEALKQLENPNAWFQVKVTQRIYVTCVANPSCWPTTWWISDISCLGFIWIQHRKCTLRQFLHVLSMCAFRIPCFSFQRAPRAAGTYPSDHILDMLYNACFYILALWAMAHLFPPDFQWALSLQTPERNL